MALRQLHMLIAPELFNEIRTRARNLGYSNTTEYVRIVLSRELREPRIPKALELLGRKPRKMGLARPKH